MGTYLFFEFFRSKKIGITLPLDPITLPYLTAEKIDLLFPFMLFAAINNFSAANFVAPYKFIGFVALSVEIKIVLLTLF